MAEFIEHAEGAYEKEGLFHGDWVLLRGTRDKYPFRTAFHAVQLEYDGEGCLYAPSRGDVDYFSFSFKVLTQKGKEI